MKHQTFFLQAAYFIKLIKHMRKHVNICETTKRKTQIVPGLQNLNEKAFPLKKKKNIIF